MDIFAHGLWTNVMLKAIPVTRNQRKTTWWGIAFGLLPDLVSFTPIFIYSFYGAIFLGEKFLSGPPGTDSPFFKYAVESYNYTHSLIVWLAVLLLVWLILRKFPWAMLGWSLHIALDIFSHTEAFFATPFLFPLSGFKVSAFSWAHPVFMIINYGFLIVIYFFIIPKLKKQKAES